MSTLDIFFVFVFVFGLIFGSFLNVLIHRLPYAQEGEILDTLSFPSSRCPTCKSQLKIWHNIPLISYFLLKGRCGFCNIKINYQYPIVEIANAFLWMMTVWHWGMQPAALLWAIFLSFLLALSFIDIQTNTLPDALTQPLLWIGLLASCLGLIQIQLEQAIWGASSGYLSLWFVANVFKYFTGKEGMGAGDFKLLAALGGWLGPLALIHLVSLASVSGAIVGIWMQHTNRLERDGYLPFGPFLAAAGVIQAFFPNFGI